MEGLPPHGQEQSVIDLIVPISGENVVSFATDSIAKLPEVFFMMPNIETFQVSNVELSKGFLQPNPDGLRANAKFLPSLQSLWLKDFTLEDGDWGHLTTYLVHQTSDNQTISLDMSGDSPYVHPGVAEEIKGLVKEFTVTVTES